MKQQPWKNWVSKGLLLTTLATQSSLVAVFGAPAVAVAATSTPVVINEVSPAGDWVELYANADVNFNDQQGWTLVTTNGTSVRLTGTMATGQLQTFTFATAPLGPDSGFVKLTHDGVDADMVRWGTERGAHVPGVSGNNSIARTDDGDGRWVSNVTATNNASNESMMSSLPPVVTTVKVPATDSSAVNAVNNASQSNVTVQAAWNGSGTLSVALIDNGGKTTGVTTAGSETLSENQITGINAGGLNEGTAWALAYTSNSAGVRSAWTSQTIWKDTIAPATPSPMVAAGERNGTDVVNQYNVGSVKVSIGTPEMDAKTMAATFTDSNGATVSGVREVNSQQAYDLRDLADGALTLTVNVTDASGNISNVGTKSTIGKDTVAPAAPSNLQGQASSNGSVALSWDASTSGDIGSYRIYGDNTSGSIDPNSALGTVDAGTRTFTTPVMPNGKNLFKVVAIDRYGNAETTGTTATVTVAGPLEKEALSTSTQRMLNLTDPLRITLLVGPNTKGTANLSVLNQSTTNPTAAALPSGHVPVGKYFEVGTDNATIFPLQIKIYYTVADLKAVGVNDDKQLEGIRFYNSKTKNWELYSSTGVNTQDVTIGNLDFAGYVWANADHLTPVVASADIAAPSKPNNLLATAGDGTIKLTWDRVAETAGYTVRYRQATNDDRKAYQTVYVNGGDVTTVTLKGFENGVLYEFGVAGIDWVGNEGKFAVVEQTPVTSSARADFVVPSKAASQPAPASSTVVAQGSTGSTSSTDTADGTSTQSDQPQTSNDSAVGGSVDGTDNATTPTDQKTDEQSATDQGEQKDESSSQTAGANSRTLVTILIIVIAAAAGFGGYYGYQWWMTKPEGVSAEETSTEEPKKKPEKPTGDNDRNGRW